MTDNEDKTYIHAIQVMMHGQGDCPKPLESSAVLIEKILYQQIKSLLYQAYDVCLLRGGTYIQAFDFLFLMRKNPIKVHRLLDFLAVKDAKVLYQEEAIKAEQPILKTTTMQKCLNILKKIDTTGELTDRSLREFDEIKHKRRVRAEFVSRILDDKKYMEYALARSMTFTCKSGKQGFQLYQWLTSKGENLPQLPKPNTLASLILCYLAHETLAQIMDLSFLMREDVIDGVDPVNSSYCGLLGSNLPQFSVDTVEKNYGITPLSPGEIEVAVARYWSPSLCPLSHFSRNVPPLNSKRLLAC